MYYVKQCTTCRPTEAASWVVALRHNKLSVPMSTQICRWPLQWRKKLIIIETNNGVGDQEYVTSLMN